MRLCHLFLKIIFILVCSLMSWFFLKKEELQVTFFKTILNMYRIFLLSSHRKRQPYCMETCICRDTQRQLRCSGDAPYNARRKSYSVSGITVCSSESWMSCRKFRFIRNWFLNLFCHCLTIFPTHSRVYINVSDKRHHSLTPSFLAFIFHI